MKRSTRLGYAFAFAIVVGVPTPLALALISRKVADAFLEGNWFGIYWLTLFALAYLLIPVVSRYLRPHHKESSKQSMGYLERCAYAFGFTVITSAITYAMLMQFSKQWAFIFFDENYYAGIFVAAFLFAPLIGRFVRSRRNGEPRSLS